MKSWAWVISLCFIVGCSNSTPHGFYIAEISGFEDIEKQKIEEMLSEINQLSGENLLSTSSGDKPIFITRANLSGTDTGKVELGLYNCKIKLDPDNQLIQNDLNNLKYVLVHQLGHCGGLEYSTETSSIMYPTFSGVYDTVAENKIKEFIPILKQVLK